MRFCYDLGGSRAPSRSRLFAGQGEGLWTSVIVGEVSEGFRRVNIWLAIQAVGLTHGEFHDHVALGEDQTIGCDGR